MRTTPEAIAARARELCSESEEHHAKTWFCMTCKLLEQRLTPTYDVLAPLLNDVGAVHLTRWPD
ncbi:hypothetical protein BKG68_12600 [Mycobacteroides saopaulense]|uniref:Uncharacterized protein n=1 Tax=Mycobacteroides saopaulense TaxID=1578165 RepID=A0ABX3BZ07_9MYCO|nr:hypothetical protein BKG68_12600 [Mycobacteroides saopaulense]OHU08990.1 hypothetical protein BKG73_17290 [Mycobacteroides saopaulense]